MVAQPHVAPACSARPVLPSARRTSATVEPLEHRIVPASIAWDGGGDGSSWHNALNWSGDQLPGLGDDVTINLAGTVNVIFSTGSVTVNSLTMNGDTNLSIVAGALTLNTLSTVHDLAISGSGRLAAGAQVTLTGAASFSGGGALTGPGVFINSGSLAITGGEPDLRTELQNTGTIVHGNAYLDFDGPAAKLRVLPGGIYTTTNTTGDFGFRQFGGGLGITIEAGGTYRHDSSNAVRFLTNTGNNPSFNVDGGTISILSGTLGVNSQGTWTNATISVATGAALNFLNGASVQVEGAITGTGAGAVNLTESAGFAIKAAGATFNFAPDLFRWSSSASIGGPGIVTNAGHIAITGGEPNLGTELRNSGTIVHGNAYFDFDVAGAKLRNLQGGVYSTANTVSDFGFRQFIGGLGLFIENGSTFRHESPTGARFLTNTGNNPGFHNDGGTIEVVNGTLGINSTGSFTNATVNVSATGAVHLLNGGSITVQGTFGGSGPGTVSLREGSVLSIAAAGATVSFPANGFVWSDSSTITGPGVLTNTGFISITSGEPNLATELRNAGTITHGNAYLDMDAAPGLMRVLNDGLYLVTNTVNDFGLRQFNGGQGISIEPGGVFRHQSPNGSRFLTNTGNAPAFKVTGGTLDVVSGTLGINTNGQFTDVTITVADNAALTFLGGTAISVEGLITGSGDGSVILTDSALLTVATAGATFDFSSGLLQWNSSASIGGSGVLHNIGGIDITGGEPNLRTELRNFGTITHGNAYLDLEALGAKLRVMPGGLYTSSNTVNDFGFRQFNGGLGLFVEGGGTFRHHSSTNARFLSNTGNNPSFNVSGGTIEVLGGTLGINGSGQFTDATIQVVPGSALNILSGGNVTAMGLLSGTGGGNVNLTQSGVLTIAADGAELNFPEGRFNWDSSASILGTGTVINSGFIQITGGDPNLGTHLRNSGTITHGNAYLDFDVAGATLRILDGGLFKTINTVNDYGFRQFNGGQGIFVESGGTLRHDSPNSARFLTNTGNNPNLSVDGGRIEVARGTLGINGPGTLSNVDIQVESGAVLNFLSGSNVTIIGELTGTGAGAVNLIDAGFLSIGATGANFNFAPGLFHWRGSSTIGGAGALTNEGEISIVSDDPNLQTELRNTGTILHGNAYLDFDAAGGKLRILDGGAYVTVNTINDYGFRQFNGGQGVFVEAGGTFQHNSPNAARFLTNTGNSPTFSNTGTVEVVKGTFFLNGTTPQFAGGVLTAGAWDVKAGATLSFNNASVTALGFGTTVTLNGNAAFTGLAALTQNAGTLRFLGGADFTAPGAFTNDGTLALGPGTIFTANAFTQSATGLVEFQIGGVSAAQNGKLVVTNAATLAGNARVEVVGGFGSVAGQSATVMTYGSRSGTFANIDGLSIGGVEYFQANTGATALTITAIRDAADLRPETISGPTDGFLGLPITVTFTVRNLEDVATLTSSWVDAVYLSVDGFLDDGDVLIGSVAHSGIVGPGGSYTATLTAPLPAAVPGEYQLLVVVDDQFEMPDSDRFNNAAAAGEGITTDLEHIAHGVTETTTISAGQSLYYQIDGPAGRDVLLTAALGTAGAARFFVKLNGIPTPADFDLSATSLTELQQKLALFGTSELPYFLLVEGTAAAAAGTGISLSTRDLGFEIVGTTPEFVPNVGTQEITISGSHFTANTTVRLVSLTGVEVVPTSVVLQNSNTLVVQFSAGALTPGLFDVRLRDSGAVTEAEDVVRIVPAQVNHTGTIAASETWFGGLVHYVTGPITVPSGVTLTIEPGAIIKFAPFTGMQVNGTLLADGTLAEPIVFTSIRDDAHGGDTNSDGIATNPLAGDWGTIAVDGTGVFDHAQLLFGGGSPSGSWSATAALRTYSGSVSFTNSAIKDAFFDGLLAWGGTVNVENSIFARIDRGISAHPGSPVTVKNSTFDDNRIALLIHGGSLDVSNSIVYNSIQHGILYDFGAPNLGIRNTDIFSTVPGAANVGNLPNPIGTNGNISSDPRFKNPSIGDYRLNFLSPAIDSANGNFAPLTDARGLARYDDPRVANTGTGAPVFTDMGALEFVENAPSPLDLVVTSVIGEPVVTGGETARVTWTVQNRGTEIVRGTWHDTLQLVSNDGTFVLHAGTVLTSATLSPGQSATFAADVPVPYGTEGQYRWQVKTNSAGEVFEGQNSGNNVEAAAERSELRIPALPIGGTIDGTFANVGSGILYKIEPVPGTDVRILLDRADAGLTEIFLGIGTAPTTANFFEHVSSVADPNARVEISGAFDTAYYVLFVPRTLPTGAANFSVGTTLATFSFDDIGVDEGSNTGLVTIPLHGSQFDVDLTARITGPDGTVTTAQAVRVDSSSLAYATFDLNELDPGAYDIAITTGGQSDSLADAFNVVAGTSGDQVRTQLILPERVRAGRIFTAYLEYTNTGLTNALAPVIELTSPTGNLMRLEAEDALAPSVIFIGVSPEGDAGILRPGQTVRIPFQVQAVAGTNTIQPGISTVNDQPYDFSALKETLRPNLEAPEYNTLFETAIRGTRTTIADYLDLLSDGATLHALRTGELENGISEVLGFLLEEAFVDRHTKIRGHVFLGDTLHPASGVSIVAKNASNSQFVGAISSADGLVRFVELTPDLFPAGTLPVGTVLPTIPAGTYHLTFEDVLAPVGLQPVVVPASGLPPEAQWIVQPGAELSGKAILPEGIVPDPESAVGVVVARNAAGKAFAADVDELGAYSLRGLPDGTYSVSLASGGKFAAPAPFTNITVTNGQVVFLDDLVGTIGGTISGIVTGPGGVPLAGVTVTAHDAGEPRSVVTDVNGFYQLAHVSAGPHKVSASIADFITGNLLNVPVADAGATAGQNISLLPYGSISGTITRDGLPVQGVTVQVENAGGDLLSFDQTDAAGLYRLPSLDAGTYTFIVDGLKYALFTEEVTLGAGENQDNDVELAPASLVGGVLRQAGTNAPLPSVTIHLLTPSGLVIENFTSADGSWSFSRMPAGHYTVMLPDGSNRHEFDVTGPNTAVTIDFSVDFGTISGKIFGDGEEPNADGYVSLLKDGQVMWTTPIAPDGTYGFTLVTPGTYDLAVSDDEHDYAVRTGVVVTSGQLTTLPPLLPGTASLQVTVTDGVLGGPAGSTGLASIVQLGIPGQIETANSMLIPPSGVINLPNLAPGDYLLTVLLPGLAQVKTIVTVGAGQNSISLAAGSPASLTGQVTVGAVAVEGARVIAFNPAEPRIRWEVSTNASGQYTMHNLPAGTYTVVVADPNAGTPSGDFAVLTLPGVTLNAGGTVTRNAAVTVSDIIVSGRIADGTEHLPSGGTAFALNGDGIRVAEAPLDVNGEFTFSTLAPGTYTIGAETGGYFVTAQTVNVAAGQTLANLTLTADWLVDPPGEGFIDNPDGIIGSGFNLLFSGAKAAVRFVLDPPQPASELNPLPIHLIPPDCDCSEAIAIFRQALRLDRTADAKFQDLNQLFDDYVIGSNLANGGIFAVQSIQYLSSLYATFYAGPLKAASALASMQDTTRKLLEFETDAGTALLTPQNYEAVRASFQQVINGLNRILNLAPAAGTIGDGLNATSGLVVATQTGDFGTSFGSVFDKFGDFVREPGVNSFLQFLGTAASFGSQITAMIGIFNTFKNNFAALSGGVPAPGILDFVNAALGALQLVATASDGIVQLQSSLEFYERELNHYSDLIQQRNQTAQRALHALFQCIANCRNEPDDDDDPAPPRRPEPPRDTPGVGAYDPNDKLTVGFGDEHFIKPETLLPYTVRFENVANATAAAQEVTITDQLSANLDWSTLELGDIGFNGIIIEVPAGLTHYETVVNVTTDANPVRVIGDFNPATGILSWTMSSFDPVTGALPEDPLSGFLPPNNAQDQGEGFVSYSIKPLSTLTTGDTITNQARIVFDVNAPIDTPLVTNTIDATAPSSSVTVLPANEAGTSFQVFWTGTDNSGGSQIYAYDVFVSDNGAPYTPFVLGTGETSATFTGEFGHTYRFYSVAVDNVGNAETAPAVADTLTSVGTFLPVAGQTFTDFDGDKYTIKISGGGTAQIIQDPAGHIALLKLTDTTAKTSVTLNVKKAGGDGRVELGGVLGDGSLKSLSAAKAFLTTGGLVLGGTLGKLALGDVLDGVDITFGGSEATKTAITLGNVSDGSRITTTSQISTLTAADYGDGRITAAALGKLTTKVGAMDAELRITGVVGAVTVKTGVNTGKWIGASFGAVTVNGGSFAADVDATGAIGKLTVKGGGINGQIKAASFAAVTITGGDFTGAIQANAGASALGKNAALKSLMVTGGNVAGTVSALGSVGIITVKADKSGTGGGVTADLVAASFGKIALKGGTFAGSATSLTPAATLGKTPAMAGLSVSGGDITGDIRLLGGLGPVSVTPSKAGAGGNISGAIITANKIAAITVGNDVSNSKLLAGADLGADGAFGGGDDTFTAGAIGAVKIKGDVIASVIAAGLSTTDAILKNADDTIVAPAPALKLLNTIAKLLIGKQADASSYFAAASFGPKPKINGAVIDPSSDPRFLVS